MNNIEKKVNKLDSPDFQKEIWNLKNQIEWNKNIEKDKNKDDLNKIKSEFDSLKDKIVAERELEKKSFDKKIDKKEKNIVAKESSVESNLKYVVPNYYLDYAKKWENQKNRVDSIVKFYKEIEKSDSNPVLNTVRWWIEKLLS